MNISPGDLRNWPFRQIFWAEENSACWNPTIDPCWKKGTFITMWKFGWHLRVSKVACASLMPSCLGNHSRELGQPHTELSPFGCGLLPITYIYLTLRNTSLLRPTATKQDWACISASLALPAIPASQKSWQGSLAPSLHSRLDYNHPCGNEERLKRHLSLPPPLTIIPLK